MSSPRRWDANAQGWMWHGPRQHLDMYVWDDGKRLAIWDDEGKGWVYNSPTGLDSDAFEELLYKRYAALRETPDFEDILEEADPMEVNDRGGRQSKLSTRFDLVPPAALYEVAKTLDEGAEKYGERNWRKINTTSHLNHALAHVNNYLQMTSAVAGGGVEASSDELIEELAHAATRLLMALEIELVGEDDE
jgi:hypothetical protein